MKKEKVDALVLSLAAAAGRKETEEQARERRSKPAPQTELMSCAHCVGASLLTAASDQLML